MPIGLEIMTGNTRLSILQCQDLAKDIGYNNLYFDLCGINGKIPCRWLDAFYGMFLTEDQEKGTFCNIEDIKYEPLWCENLHFKEEKQDELTF